MPVTQNEIEPNPLPLHPTENQKSVEEDPTENPHKKSLELLFEHLDRARNLPAHARNPYTPHLLILFFISASLALLGFIGLGFQGLPGQGSWTKAILSISHLPAIVGSSTAVAIAIYFTTRISYLHDLQQSSYQLLYTLLDPNLPKKSLQTAIKTAGKPELHFLLKELRNGRLSLTRISPLLERVLLNILHYQKPRQSNLAYLEQITQALLRISRP